MAAVQEICDRTALAAANLAGGGIRVMVVTGFFETIARVLKLLCVALLAYVGVLFVVKVDWLPVTAHAFAAHIRFSADCVMLLVPVLGTTISPYLFFLAIGAPNRGAPRRIRGRRRRNRPGHVVDAGQEEGGAHEPGRGLHGYDLL